MKKGRTILSVILTTAAIACLIAAAVIMVTRYLEERNMQQTLESLRPTLESIPEVSTQSSSESTAPQAPDTNGNSSEASPPAELPSVEAQEPEPERIANPYADSYLANADMAAWLVVPGTNIDYPVMWTPRDENYYLKRDFNKKSNSNGCLILDTDSNLDPLTTNLIIHGHNMKSGAMFGNLTKYEKEAYFKDHKQITLYTKDCQRNYEVIAAFRSQVYLKTDKVFKFYQFFQADTEAEFNDFYKNIKKLSLYDTGVTAEFGDNFITLSTCVYHVTNGRFVVVAKEVESGDTYLPVE